MKSIICKLNPEDTFSAIADYEVNLFDKEEYHYTFWNKNKRKLYQFPNSFDNVAIDLLNISLMVYYADRTVVRADENDAWTRNIKIYMPVCEIDIWNENRSLLEQMLSFLSGDKWFFNFRKRNNNISELNAKKGIERQKKKFDPNAICMLSGGLDSFIGAINLLSKDTNICFVGHYGGGKGVISYQKNVNSLLQNEYNISDDNFFNFYASPLKGKEDTTRTRSFMFFAHAIILASSLHKPINLYIPENGVISLNIPLTSTRLGSSSTRTTHPYYMGMLQNLINNLGLTITLKNPFQFKTKGEMICECNNANFLRRNIDKTMSCSHPDLGRYRGMGEPSHCGICLPCVIRRAAILKAYGSDSSNYRDSNFSQSMQSVINLKSYKLGLLEYENSTINHRLLIQQSGPIINDIDKYVGVYERGLIELKKLLDGYTC